MAAWFGHTQTLTSISKSVSTVASGILGLEANLATFIHKVTYYDKFFQRVAANLPPEVVKTASLLFARCYEYRDEIRDELESSLAYVADAGRWVIGMEDWNSKMEKRLAQISELVLLTNTLLVEYAMTGKWGAQGEKDGLGVYLQTIASSVVLHNPKHQVKARRDDRSALKVSDSGGSKESPVFPQASSMEDCGNGERRMSPLASEAERKSQEVKRTPTNDLTAEENESELFFARSSTGSGTTTSEEDVAGETPADTSNVDDDDDALNPFARAYQPPMSMESSLASLRGESDSGSVYFNAVDVQQPRVLAEHDDEYEEGDEPDSPVSLGEYECLDIESIPKYVAFKPSVLSRKRRLKQQFFGSSSSSPTSSSESLHSMPPPIATPPRVSPTVSPRAPTARKHHASGGTAVTNQASRQKLMDLTYSYDFQQEMTFNPFASPSLASEMSGEDPLPVLQLSMRQTVPTLVEEEVHSVASVEEQTSALERLSSDEEDERVVSPSESTEEATETKVDEIIHFAAQTEDITGQSELPMAESEAVTVKEEARGAHVESERHMELSASPNPEAAGASEPSSTPRRSSRDDDSEVLPSLLSPPSPTPAPSAEDQDEFSRILDLLTPEDDDPFVSSRPQPLN